MSMQINLQHVFKMCAARTRASIGTSLAYTSVVQRDRHGVRRRFKTRLHKVVFFCRAGVKINGVFYRDVLLTKKLLPVVRYVSGNEFVFQQNSAPAHRARETIELLRRETRRTLFHRNSGHRTVQILTRWTTLIWATMQQGVYQTKIRNVELRQRLLKVWSSIEQDVIDTSTDQWPCMACATQSMRAFERQTF